VLATPVLLWPRQSLPAASAPAPGPHTSCIETACAVTLRLRQSARIAPEPFQSQVGRVFVAERERLVFSTRLVSASRLLDVRMSLFTLVKFTDVAQRRFSGMIATPESFRLTQSPLGAVLLPQALESVGPSPSPEGLSLALVGL